MAKYGLFGNGEDPIRVIEADNIKLVDKDKVELSKDRAGSLGYVDVVAVIHLDKGQTVSLLSVVS